MNLRIAAAVLASALLLAPAGATERPVVARWVDLPVVEVMLSVRPSEMAGPSDPSVLELAGNLGREMAGLLAGYDHADPGLHRQLLNQARIAALVMGDWSGALELSGLMRSLELKPAEVAMEGLVLDSYARAALAAGPDWGSFQVAFRSDLASALAALDGSLVANPLRRLRSEHYLLSRNALMGEIEGPLDAAAAAQQMRIDARTAAAILNGSFMLNRLLPLAPVVVEELDRRLQRADASPADRWSERLVDLAEEEVGGPAIVGIWDTGLDPAVFQGRLWANPSEVPNGRDDDLNGFVDDIHGFAFDEDRQPSRGSLSPSPAANESEYRRLVLIGQGYSDLDAGLDTDATRFLRDTLGSLSPDEIAALRLQLGRMGVYSHGTSIGSIAAAGNPGALLMHGRFAYRTTQVPEPIDEAAAQSRIRTFREGIAYFRTNGARVVNMSFALSEPRVEQTLASVEPDPARRQARARVIFESMRDAFEEAVRSAPEILFIAGAGNENVDLTAVRNFPAGLDLPNLLTVGAVDRNLASVEFSNFGSKVHLYANGHLVVQTVPGGHVMRSSGTSSAAAQVTNLAAKLLALDPTLTSGELRRIMEETATIEGPQRLRVIHPRAAMHRIKSPSTSARGS